VACDGEATVPRELANLAAHQTQASRKGRGTRLFNLLIRLPQPVFAALRGTEWFAEPGGWTAGSSPGRASSRRDNQLPRPARRPMLASGHRWKPPSPDRCARGPTAGTGFVTSDQWNIACWRLTLS
jgi:hypothetical protein